MLYMDSILQAPLPVEPSHQQASMALVGSRKPCGSTLVSEHNVKPYKCHKEGYLAASMLAFFLAPKLAKFLPFPEALTFL